MLENLLTTHDIELQIGPSGQDRPIRRMIVLTPSCINDANKPATLSKVQRFHALNGGKFCCILFPLFSLTHPNPHQAFIDLQFFLFITNRLLISIIHLPTQNDLSTVCKTLATPPQLLPSIPSINLVTDVLPSCTRNPPLSQEAITVLTDVYSSIKDMARIPRDSDFIPNMVAAGMNKAEAEDIYDFYRHDGPAA